MTADRALAVDQMAKGRLLEIAGITDRGPVRTQNQDVWDARIRRWRDGRRARPRRRHGRAQGRARVGRRRGGGRDERAHRDAVATEDPAGSLRRAVDAANQAVALVRDDIGGGPGTTLVLAIIHDSHAVIANVGDSRGYLIGASGVDPDHRRPFMGGRPGTGGHHRVPRTLATTPSAT